MKKINVEKLLSGMAKKEKIIGEAIKNLKPDDLSEAGRQEMISRLENMIAKIEAVKTILQTG